MSNTPHTLPAGIHLTYKLTPPFYLGAPGPTARVHNFFEGMEIAHAMTRLQGYGENLVAVNFSAHPQFKGLANQQLSRNNWTVPVYIALLHAHFLAILEGR